MSFLGKSFLDLNTSTCDEIESLFGLAEKIQQKGWGQVQTKAYNKTAGNISDTTSDKISDALIALVFLEPSTRTTTSFEIAALKSGYKVTRLIASESSVKKGETLCDTLLTINAMAPSLFVVRHGTTESLSEIAPQLSAPVINAGEGTTGHPTQALLDAYTIRKERKKIKGEKILFIGDVSHSRVTMSNITLLTKLGAEVAVCGPEEWLGPQLNLQHFPHLSDGLKWATVCMALRVQRERHAGDQEKTEMELISRYQLNPSSLKDFRSDGLILHPGPFNRGVEITNEVLQDTRCCIWKQVANGVFVRGALMAQILGVL